jgi:filamin
MSDIIVNGSQSPQVILNPTSNVWVEIQRNTFRNWVNEQLRLRNLAVEDLRTDFGDGVLLVALIEVLQRRKISGSVEAPTNNAQKRQNITVALDAITRDNVTIVNIGKYIEYVD